MESEILLYKGEKSMFTVASMNLREWISNDQQENQIIKEEDLAICDFVKVFGHTWNIVTNFITIKKVTNLPESNEVTKRNVLKEISSVFDLIELFSPILLKGKLLLKALRGQRLDWDNAISSEDAKEWFSIKAEPSHLPECEIKRCITLKSSDVSNFLLCFCEASTYTYASVIYLLQQNIKSESKANVLFSKTRLAPLKTNVCTKVRANDSLNKNKMFEIREIQIEDTYPWSIPFIRFSVYGKMDSFREESFSVCSKQSDRN